jgi:hypothetical protein
VIIESDQDNALPAKKFSFINRQPEDSLPFEKRGATGALEYYVHVFPILSTYSLSDVARTFILTRAHAATNSHIYLLSALIMLTDKDF